MPEKFQCSYFVKTPILLKLWEVPFKPEEVRAVIKKLVFDH